MLNFAKSTVTYDTTRRDLPTMTHDVSGVYASASIHLFPPHLISFPSSLMPPQRLSLGPGLKTCASNKFKHPGNILTGQPVQTDKTHDDHEQMRQAEAEKEQAVLSARKEGAVFIASMEDALVAEDQAREQARIDGYKGKWLYADMVSI